MCFSLIELEFSSRKCRPAESLCVFPLVCVGKYSVVNVGRTMQCAEKLWILGMNNYVVWGGWKLWVPFVDSFVIGLVEIFEIWFSYARFAAIKISTQLFCGSYILWGADVLHVSSLKFGFHLPELLPLRFPLNYAVLAISIEISLLKFFQHVWERKSGLEILQLQRSSWTLCWSAFCTCSWLTNEQVEQTAYN